MPAPVVRLVLAFLRPADVAACACACRDWAAAARLPRVWHNAVRGEPALRTYACTKGGPVAVCRAAGASVWRQYVRRTGARAHTPPAANVPARVLWCAYSMCMARAVSLTERIRNQPRLRFTLLPGATPAALARAEASFGVKLPMQLRCLWLVFNGQHPAHNQLGNGLLGAKGRLGSVEECVTHVQALRDRAELPVPWPRAGAGHVHESVGAAGEHDAVAASVTSAATRIGNGGAAAGPMAPPRDASRRDGVRVPAGTARPPHAAAPAASVPCREGRRLLPVGPAQGFSRIMVDVDSGEAVLVTSLNAVRLAPDVCGLIESAAAALLT